MKASDIPDKFPIPFAANAGPSYVRNVPTASQIGVTPGAASLNDGFPPLNFTPIGSGGVPPFGQDANGILRQATSWDRWFSAGGAVGYDAGFSSSNGGYPAGSIVAALAARGSFWLSTVDDNTTNPDTGGANWVGFTPISLYGVDSGSANACILTLSPPPVSLAAMTGMAVRIVKGASPNTGATTLNVNSFGVINILHPDGTPLTSGELPASGVFTVVYDGTRFQLQSASGTTVTPAQLQVQAGNYALDTGTANNLAVALTIIPPSLASINGSPIRVKKSASPNAGNATLNVNSLGGQPIKHADGSQMQVGELPANGLFEVAWDNAAAQFTLLSAPLSPGVQATDAQMEAGSSTSTFASPANFLFSEFACKGMAIFHYTGGILTTTYKSSTILSISRNSTGNFTIQMQGGLSFVAGFAIANGGAAVSPGSAGSLGMGSRFTGVDPAITVKFGDAGGSGGQLSDPSDAFVAIFGITNN